MDTSPHPAVTRIVATWAPKGTALIVAAVVLFALSLASMFTPLFEIYDDYGSAQVSLWRQCIAYRSRYGYRHCQSTVSREMLHGGCTHQNVLFMLARVGAVATLAISVCAVLPLGIMDWYGRPACCFHGRRRIVSIIVGCVLILTTMTAWVSVIVLWRYAGSCWSSYYSAGWVWGPFAPLMIVATVCSAVLVALTACCTRERMTIPCHRDPGGVGAVPVQEEELRTASVSAQPCWDCNTASKTLQRQLPANDTTSPHRDATNLNLSPYPAYHHQYPMAASAATTTTATSTPPPSAAVPDDDVVPVARRDEHHLYPTEHPPPAFSSDRFRDAAAPNDDDNHVVMGVPVYQTTDAPASAAPLDHPPLHDVMSPNDDRR